MAVTVHICHVWMACLMCYSSGCVSVFSACWYCECYTEAGFMMREYAFYAIYAAFFCLRAVQELITELKEIAVTVEEDELH